MLLTQEKIIQALGRIGRNNIQQEYSARFRDDSHIKLLFEKIDSNRKPEVINMNILFNSKKVVWDGNDFIEVQDEAEKDDENINIVANEDEYEVSDDDEDDIESTEIADVDDN